MKKAVSISLILLGILGTIIPVLPGWIFILIGLALMSQNLSSVASR